MKRSIQELGQNLDQAADAATVTQQISLSQDISLKEAYKIQEVSIDQRLKRGEVLTGYKLGFTSKAKMEQMGVHDLIWGRLTDKMHYKNGGNLNSAQFIHPRVEPEIAFLIGKTIDHQLVLEEATEYLDGVAAALEVIDSRYENFKFSLEDVIADNCSSAAYVIGEWHPPATTVEDLNISLSINNEVSQSGNSNAILDNPMESLIAISRILSEQGIAIEPGMVILAGAATPASFIHPGDQINSTFEGLGEVSLNVVQNTDNNIK
ncbi:MAG: fumarylacetoacetate hydrolase family protein [Bacteroidia bacterium]|nr:fumarylacetoacetate hydrolase family protein [Bacteroidia bacterium]